MIRHPSDFSLTPKKGAKKGNLYRSGGARTDAIYCRFFVTRNGKKKEVRRSTGMTTEREARAKAWAIWQNEKGLGDAGKAPALQRSTSPKLGRVVNMFLEKRPEISEASESSVRDYVGSLRRAVQLVESKDWENVNLSRISDEFVHAWRKARYAARGLTFGEPEDVDPALNNSLNSEMTNMRAIFSRHALQAYRDAGMTIPDTLQRFLNVRQLPGEEEGFTPIDAEVDLRMQTLAKAAIHRARGIDYVVPKEWESEVPPVEVGVAFELARFGALTRKEMVSCRVDWFTEDRRAVDVRNRAEERFYTKGRKKNGLVPMRPVRVEWWLEALGCADEDYLMLGTEHQRKLTCQRAAPQWIAQYLPDRHKRLHELRKMAGWDVWKGSGSLSAAAAFLRDTEATARRYYLPRKHDSGQFGVTGL